MKSHDPTSASHRDASIRSVLVSLATELARDIDFETLMTRVCTHTRDLVGCDRSSIFLRDGDVYRARFNSGNPHEVDRFFGELSFSLDDPRIERIASADVYEWIPDARAPSEEGEPDAERSKVASLAVAVLRDHDQKRLGFITAEFDAPTERIPEPQESLFEDIAQIASLAVERHEALQERELARSQQDATNSLVALGRFAGSIAHDFNNRLTVIVGTAELIAEEVRGTQIEPDIEELLRSAEASAGLTQKLFDLSTGHFDRNAASSVSHVLTGIRGLVSRVLPRDVAFSVGVHAVDLNVGLDHQDVERIILNLVVHLVDTSEGDLGIQVDARAFELGEVSPPWTNLDAGEYVEISVRLAGAAPLPVGGPRVFDPIDALSQRKLDVGLAIVSSLVQEAGGTLRIDATNEEQPGFLILLPRLDGILHEDFDRRHEPSLSGHTGTILLVDDDEPIRRLVHRTLRARGHEVIEANNGMEAVQIAAALPGEIDILLTDVVMPGMGGIELAKSLVRSRPNLQVLLMSGYAPDARGRSEFEPANIRFIPKPFSTTRIAEAVDTCFTCISRVH